jgi:hypothetical protein
MANGATKQVHRSLEVAHPVAAPFATKALVYVRVVFQRHHSWVWLQYPLAKKKWALEPQLFLQLLRFNEMSLWFMQVVLRQLHADQR